MTPKPRRKLTILRPIGLLLLAAALLLTAYNIWDDGRAAVSSQRILSELDDMVPEQPTPEPSESQEPEPPQEMPTVLIDGNECIGTLDFPTLDLTLPVMSDWDYDKLKSAPCRYAGTVYQSGFVIAGHNYRKHFGPLNRIQVGDAVIFTDVNGNEYSYQVAEMQVLEPTAIEDMLSDNWDLSLFTCTLGGQTRLTVRCNKIETGD